MAFSVSVPSARRSGGVCATASVMSGVRSLIRGYRRKPQRLLQSVEPALAMLTSAIADAKNAKEEIAGPLRISAPKALGSFFAVAHIREGRLVPLLTRQMTQRESIYIYYRHRTERPLRVRTFIDFTIAKLAGNADFCLTPTQLRALAK